MVFSGFFKFPLVNELNIFYCCKFHAILAEIKTNGAIFKKPIRFFSISTVNCFSKTDNPFR